MLPEKWCILGFRLLLLAFFLFVAYLARPLFVSFILAAGLTYLVHPIVIALERRGHGHVIAIVLSFAGVTTVCLIVFFSLLPDLAFQLARLLGSLPLYAGDAEKLVTYLESSYLHMIPAVLAKYLDQRIFASEEALMAIVRHLLDGLLQVVKLTMWFAMAPVIAFYFLRDGARWKAMAVGVLPEDFQGEASLLLSQMDHLGSAFFRGQLLVCAIVALLSWGALYLLGVQWAVLLGLFAGVSELIPYFGPFIGAAPAIVVSLAQGPWLPLKVLVAFFLIQQLEGNIISPKLMGDRLGLHPLVIIVALVAGGNFGLTGLFLAVPVAAFLSTIIRFLAARVLRDA